LLILCMAAGSAWLLQAPTAALLLAGFAFVAAVWGLVVVQEAVLIREGRGWRVAIILALSEAVGLAVLIGAMVMHAGVLALAFARIAAVLVVAFGYIGAARGTFRFSWQIQDLRDMARYSASVAGGKVLDWANGNGSDLLLGIIMSTAAVGQFRMGARMHQAVFGATAQALAGPILSHLGRSWARMRSAVPRASIRVLRLQLTLAVPAFVLLGTFAPDFIHVALGPSWAEAGMVLEILCLAAPAIVGSITMGSLLLASGRAGALLRFQLVMSVPLLFALLAGSAGGPTGVALAKAAYLVAYLVGQVVIADE
ncbi:oligosaccharide flippase family protein, partial [Nostoc sp. NIES-2111]